MKNGWRHLPRVLIYGKLPYHNYNDMLLNEECLNVAKGIAFELEMHAGHLLEPVLITERTPHRYLYNAAREYDYVVDVWAKYIDKPIGIKYPVHQMVVQTSSADMSLAGPIIASELESSGFAVTQGSKRHHQLFEELPGFGCLPISIMIGSYHTLSELADIALDSAAHAHAIASGLRRFAQVQRHPTSPENIRFDPSGPEGVLLS